MSVHLVHELRLLDAKLVSMTQLVGDLVHRSMATLEAPVADAASQLSELEERVDHLDVEVEELALRLLALYQPVASDLRQIATSLKVSGELERIADLAVNLAERAASLVSLPAVAIPEQLREMTVKAVQMLDQSVSCYLGKDQISPQMVCMADDAVDALNRRVIDELTALIRRQPELAEPALHLFSACRIIERIADHATNIAEDVIYLREGHIVRHSRAHKVPA